MSKPHIITISGPSLSGKTELSHLLQKELNYNAVVSVTTRPRRSQEKDGVDYYFLNNDEYKKLEQENKLVQKTNNGDINYGVTEQEVIKKQSKPIIWVIMPKSINQIEKMCEQRGYNLTKVFINNSEDVLFERLFTRFQEDKIAKVDTYVKRLKEMIGVEKDWINQANFNLIIDSFTDDNKFNVLKQINDEVEKKKSLKNKGFKM